MPGTATPGRPVVGLTGFAAAKLAIVLLAVGDLSEAEGILRAGLAASGNTSAEVTIRLHAAMLAARRGANDAARDHLLRARELFARPRGTAMGNGGSAHGRGVAGSERPGRGVRARRACAARERRRPASRRRADGVGGPGRGRPGRTRCGRPRPGRRTGPSGGPDPTGRDARDPARDRLPALRSRRHRSAGLGGPLRRRVRAGRRGRGPDRSLEGGGGGVCRSRPRVGPADLLMAACLRPDPVGHLAHARQQRCSEVSTSTPSSKEPYRYRPASRSLPPARASR